MQKWTFFTFPSFNQMLHRITTQGQTSVPATFYCFHKKRKNLHEVCADTGCGVSLIDKKIPNLKNTKLPDICANETRNYENSRFKKCFIQYYGTFLYYFPRTAVNHRRDVTKLTNSTRHVYIIEKLKTKMLVKYDILNPEIMVPNIGKNNLTIVTVKT